MIPSSWIAKSLAGTSAFALLSVMLAAATTDAPVRIEGGSAGSPIQAQLGSSFTDLTQGPRRADVVEAMQTAAPPQAQPMRPDTPAPGEPSIAQPTPDSAPEDASTVSTDLPTVAVTPDTAVPAPTASPAPERIVGQEPEPGVVLSSRRPPTRTRAFEQANRRPDPPPRSTASAPQISPTQESRPRNTAGSNSAARSTSNAQGGARSQTTRPSQDGNAAASNYPGQVMARLNRVRRPSIRATGQARVAFTISASGRLSNVGIAGSSGSFELDRAAVRIVQRAAPFPPPPPGAQRSFAINISGR
ncbi:Gram-negative bacterial tonB protein [Rhodobacteraceae bacterium THAF1]|uniref:TonB family protein n=1 Tax=Palleronia sp. THAF1 TaxID=2587842 RepID=UPI000F3D483B|nr:TonB family protein [Palleronia sp. THAF1]QFU08746.1 Gram-negative bacterial tonB protein [Palleronia sp. THAF1]VDC31279.1 Gram-negative bacterial tonB protein [Rhodobacteraceae bacterium THAF1]